MSPRQMLAVAFLAGAAAPPAAAVVPIAPFRNAMVRNALQVGQQPDVSEAALEANTSLLAGELRCPVCQGNSIQDSPSELAQEMRNLIRDQLRAGKTPAEVRSYFVDKYGEWILLAPKAEGLNLVVYLVPFAVLIAGGAVVWRTVRKWTAAT